MGRKPRQHYRGAIYHFIARGNDRQPIFLDDGDRRAFERFLGDGVERLGHRSHAYCWMTNHVHMAVEVADVPLSHIAHNLLFRYARWFHRKHGRSARGRRVHAVYIPYATEESTGLSTAPPQQSAPWIMRPGTPTAHVMIVLEPLAPAEPGNAP